MSIFNILKFWDKKEEIVEYTKPTDIVINEINIDIPPVKTVVDNIDNKKPIILLMDDFEGMTTLIKDELDRVQCCDVFKEFTIKVATGDYAAFSVENMLNEDPYIKIDVAFLDITLGGVIYGKEYDGIDVAIMLKKRNPKCVIRFITGHTLNKKNPEIFQFIQKFESYFNTPFDSVSESISEYGVETVYNHIINKNGNRVFLLGTALEEFMNKNEN